MSIQIDKMYGHLAELSMKPRARHQRQCGFMRSQEIKWVAGRPRCMLPPPHTAPYASPLN